MSSCRKILLSLGALLCASIVWLACLHLFFQRAPSDFYQARGLSPQADALAARHLQLWREPQSRERELQKMRASNAEWDFMGRSFLVWSLANISLRDPASQAVYLQTMDQIIEETLRLEQEKGLYFFLMPYAHVRPWVMQPPRSLFLDGEIAMMLAARRLVEEKPEYKPLLSERVRVIVDCLNKSPQGMAESYPDECWTFDHVNALVAVRMADCLDGTDHSALIRGWLSMAKQKLIHPKTGLLVSNSTLSLRPLNGPEGSSLWMIAHALQPLDPAFARDQYDRTRRELAHSSLGFGYAREWPVSWESEPDIDSGPIIPVFKISAGSSGMAFIGATAFEDTDLLGKLATTLQFVGFPSRSQGRLKYCASNQVGDTALLYAATLGPLWKKIATLP